jgi:hypothetical protein
MTIEFQPWPKIARLNRDCVITEKIDGTNAAVGIVRIVGDDAFVEATASDNLVTMVRDDRGLSVDWYAVYAQSRKKIITPKQDNAGFAAYVLHNAFQLVATLGEGLHFGEWWGSGIQRGYGLPKGEKRFSLFNTPRYGKPEFDLTQVPGLGTVPVLYEGPFNTNAIMRQISVLEHDGSWAAPGFTDPEGIIVFHTAAQMPFKVTIKDDEKPKGSNE